MAGLSRRAVQVRYLTPATRGPLGDRNSEGLTEAVSSGAPHAADGLDLSESEPRHAMRKFPCTRCPIFQSLGTVRRSGPR